MVEKCHFCGNPIQVMWVRGQLQFCSERCRDESKKAGEPYEGWVALGPGDGFVFIKPNQG